MKRYYIVPDAHMPSGELNVGHWHGIDLGSHGPAGAGHHVVVLLDDHVEPPDTWVPLPHLYDARTTMGKHAHRGKLTDVGVTDGHTGYDVANALHKIHPMFRP